MTSVSLSFCGNFGLIGSAKGAIDLYNMQSGLHRRSFGKDGPSHQQHSKAVTGLTTDNLSRVVYSCSLDGTVKVFNQNVLIHSSYLCTVYLFIHLIFYEGLVPHQIWEMLKDNRHQRANLSNDLSPRIRTPCPHCRRFMCPSS